ncbi:MAG: hypothetical protein QXQ18_00720 [Candidatus Aenigmatarchaeota archaeon]
MGGLLHHLAAGLISAALVYWYFRHRDFAISIFIGNFLHDIFIFAYAPIFLGTLDITKIVKSAFFFNRDPIFLILWMGIQSIFVALFLFFQKFLRKKEFREFEYNVGFLLLGIITHMTMDIFIQEQGILY